MSNYCASFDVEAIPVNFIQYKEKEALKLCLKFLRRSGYVDLYERLQVESCTKLEHEIVKQLYTCLVNKGDYAQVEEIVSQAFQRGFFVEYVHQQPYSVQWFPVQNDDADVYESCTNAEEQSPGPRGGHHMVIDDHNSNIYMFGGFDGTDTLSDFWSFDICSKKWSCLNKNTALDNGPSARSLHKMLFDVEHNRIFCLGKYTPHKLSENDKADFFVYSVIEHFWTKISDNTSEAGGPPLLCDHQLALDVEHNVMYCFGGRIIEMSFLNDNTVQMFAGLYSYNIQNDTWMMIRPDISASDDHNAAYCIKGRSGHSMAFDQKSESLYIVGGQRGNEYILDILIYSTATDELRVVAIDSGIIPSPISGFTQSAAFDSTSGRLFIYTGFFKDRAGSKKAHVQNVMYEYDIYADKWKHVYSSGSLENHSPMNKNDVPTMCDFLHNRHIKCKVDSVDRSDHPVPRYSHQMVYHSAENMFYMFGGNPGSEIDFRLDDFWCLKLNTVDTAELERRCKLQVRQCQFYEMLNSADATGALIYLQTCISPLVDVENCQETHDLHHLASQVFDPSIEKENCDEQHQRRIQLFDDLNRYFPEDFTEPKTDLVDLIPI